MYKNDSTAKYIPAEIDLPQQVFPPKHPFMHKENHRKLLDYITSRFDVASNARDPRIERMINVDIKIAGWFIRNLDDNDSQRHQERTGQAKAQDVNLPITQTQLDDMLTYFATTFAPSQGMFHESSAAGTNEQAKVMTRIMNSHAIYSDYYRNMLLAVYSLLKHNVGGVHVFWQRESGSMPTGYDEEGQAQFESQVRWEGNRMEAIDLYNFLHDPAVQPHEIHRSAEFAGCVMLKSHYWLQSRAARGAYYNVEELLSQHEDGEEKTHTYYRRPPSFAEESSYNSDAHWQTQDGQVDWVQYLNDAKPEYAGPGYELLEGYIRLNPKQFGLDDAAGADTGNGYQLWRFTIAQGKYIIDLKRMENVHDQIPYYLSYINDDFFADCQRSVAESIQPLNDFASFMMNIHIRASRKGVWGNTYYDPSRIDLDQIPAGSVDARIPVNTRGQGQDIRSIVFHDNLTPNTQDTMRSVDSVLGIVDKFYPTQAAPSQVAGIDRAVKSQVAAVQQGANRRQQKAARLIDSLMMRPARFAMFYNIVQFMTQESPVIDYQTNEAFEVDLSQVGTSAIPYVIGQGLKMIDRQAAQESLQGIVFALIQAPQAGQQFDLPRLIGAWADMADVDINIEDFRLQPDPAAAPQVDASGNPIQPAVSPANVDSPIFAERAQP